MTGCLESRAWLMGIFPIHPVLLSSCWAEAGTGLEPSLPIPPGLPALSSSSRCGYRPRPHTGASSIVWLRLTAMSRWVSCFFGALAWEASGWSVAAFFSLGRALALENRRPKSGAPGGWVVAQCPEDGAQAVLSLPSAGLRSGFRPEETLPELGRAKRRPPLP